MKKSLLTVVAICVGILLLGVPTPYGRQITLKSGDYFAVKSPAALAIDRFAELVDEKSNHELKIEAYHASQLGKQLAQIDAVRMGSQDIKITGLPLLQHLVPATRLTNLFYLYRDFEHYRSFLKSPLYKELIEKPLLDKGLIFINPEWNWNDGPYRVFISKTPVFSLDDLQGMKMRIYPSKTAIRMWRHLGPIPTVVAWAESYLALKQGLVSGITCPINLLYSVKLTEVAKFVAKTKQYYTVPNFMLNVKRWKQLSKEHQDALVQSAIEASAYATELATRKTEGDIEKMKKEHNAVFIEMNLEPFRERMKTLFPVLEEEGFIPKGATEKIQKF